MAQADFSSLSCELKATIELWHNGVKVGSHDYAEKLSGNNFSDGNRFLKQALKDVTHDISIQAVPDIVKDFSAQLK